MELFTLSVVYLLLQGADLGQHWHSDVAVQDFLPHGVDKRIAVVLQEVVDKLDVLG